MEWIETSKEQADWNFCTSIITGDTSDCIPGLKGKGIKYAEKVLNGFNTDFGVTRTDYIKEILGAYIFDLGEIEGIKQFYTNYNLLKLLDDYPNFNIPNILKYELPELNF